MYIDNELIDFQNISVFYSKLNIFDLLKDKFIDFESADSFLTILTDISITPSGWQL